MELFEALNWRIATKKFDSKKLSEDQVSQLVEAFRLAPTSYGLQALKLIIVNDEQKRALIREAAYGQPQVTDASHLFVLSVQANYDEKDVDGYAQLIAETRGVSIDSITGFISTIKNSVNNLDETRKVTWLSKQVYLALGVLLTSAAIQEIDACPMEGFNPEKVDEILGLQEKGLRSLVLVPVGYRSEDDVYPKLKKVRKSKDSLVLEY